MTAGATDRMRQRRQLQADMERQRAEGRLRRSEDRRDARHTYLTNRQSAASSIGDTYGDAAKRSYLAGRATGGVYGIEASNASAQGLGTQGYIQQRANINSMAAQDYATRTNADANLATGRGNELTGHGNAIRPLHETEQQRIATGGQMYVADRGLDGVRDTNEASRYGSYMQGRVGFRNAEAQENIGLMQHDAATRPVAQPIVPLGEGTAYYDPSQGRAITEDEQQLVADERAMPARQTRDIASLERVDPQAAADVLDDLTARYMEDNPGATQEEADAFYAEGGGMAEYLARLDEARGGKRRENEFIGGDANVYNRRFWQNPYNAIPGVAAVKLGYRFLGGE